ncbi:DUF6233 domain-containing protein [Streptomyces sp. AK02-04a]|uniref:DUF6233 domain-containing protein n=1 Tax=Streptomyces sp. AK02-04a TaxID=3028649 RepID=UPI0029BC33A8|nr:DUF6233 domain-containing protein [Streptomyces sp. AK02-04a]MDX3763475.1 DUF6233 domain-containing protein [Streptomyces sp. AK02-04a]
MFDDLPPDLARLLTLRVWHATWLQRIDTKIAALQERETEQEQGRNNRPQEPDWIVELGIGNGRPPTEVHVGGCYAAGRRRRPVPRDEARRLLTSGVRACTHCKPSTGVKTRALVHFLWLPLGLSAGRVFDHPYGRACLVGGGAGAGDGIPRERRARDGAVDNEPVGLLASR